MELTQEEKNFIMDILINCTVKPSSADALKSVITIQSILSKLTLSKEG